MTKIEEIDKYYKENYSFDKLKNNIYENDEFVAFRKRLSESEFNAIKDDLEELFEIWFNLGFDLGFKYGQVYKSEKDKEFLDIQKKQNDILQKLSDYIDNK